MEREPGCGLVPPLIEWVICGGESGPRARPTQPAWARSLRDQCGNADVPFFYGAVGRMGSAERRGLAA
jgi:protein gp37